MSCCPEGSWGELKKDADYVDKGTVEQAGDLPVYRVGTSEKCIIWNYDIFGFDSGRTRQLCDQLADKGFMVILPDYYRGKLLDPSTAGMPKLVEFVKNETKWSALKADWQDKIKPYAEKHGAKVFGTIGTCWGNYPVIKLSSLPEFKAGVSLHPSHPTIMGPNLLNEDESAAFEAIKGTHQMFMPAGDDADSVKPGGLGEKIIGKNLEIIEFNDMKHGWTTRGDISDPKVDAEVKRAMAAAATFFEKYLK